MVGSHTRKVERDGYNMHYWIGESEDLLKVSGHVFTVASLIVFHVALQFHIVQNSNL